MTVTKGRGVSTRRTVPEAEMSHLTTTCCAKTAAARPPAPMTSRDPSRNSALTALAALLSCCRHDKSSYPTKHHSALRFPDAVRKRPRKQSANIWREIREMRVPEHVVVDLVKVDVRVLGTQWRLDGLGDALPRPPPAARHRRVVAGSVRSIDEYECAIAVSGEGRVPLIGLVRQMQQRRRQPRPRPGRSRPEGQPCPLLRFPASSSDG